jgi:MOSC domain-containing protein YiiM
MEIVKLYRCADHVYVGHFGRPAGTLPMTEIEQARLVAGKGVVGDRYFSGAPGHPGQITFFAEEIWLRLCDALKRRDRDPGVFRRNVIVRGADLDALIGKDFECQGIRFHGSEYCKPCFWMDEAFAPGALKALSAWRGGGLRAQILSDGVLRTEKEGSGAGLRRDEPCTA